MPIYGDGLYKTFGSIAQVTYKSDKSSAQLLSILQDFEQSIIKSAKKMSVRTNSILGTHGERLITIYQQWQINIRKEGIQEPPILIWDVASIQKERGSKWVQSIHVVCTHVKAREMLLKLCEEEFKDKESTEPKEHKFSAIGNMGRVRQFSRVEGRDLHATADRSTVEDVMHYYMREFDKEMGSTNDEIDGGTTASLHYNASTATAESDDGMYTMADGASNDGYWVTIEPPGLDDVF
jgi:hypothetical protein